MPPKRRSGPSNADPLEKKARPSKLAKENNISAAQESEIQEAFSLFAEPDPDQPRSKHGVIPTGSVRQALTALGTPPASNAELKELLEAVDPDESGAASYENFVAIAALKLHQRSDEGQREEIEAAFRLFLGKTAGLEADESTIQLSMLRRVARELKEDTDDKLLKDMILEANGGAGIGQGVSLDQFEDVMKRAGVF